MLSDLNLDLNKYQQSRDGHISSRIIYVNSSEGITFEVDEFSRKVVWSGYQPTQSQQKFLCPDASNRLPVGRSQADVLSKVDVYGDVSPNMERERLDSVAAYLNIRPEAKAYLIAYAGRISQKGEAGARAACARSYLIKKHHIQADPDSSDRWWIPRDVSSGGLCRRGRYTARESYCPAKRRSEITAAETCSDVSTERQELKPRMESKALFSLTYNGPLFVLGFFWLFFRTQEYRRFQILPVLIDITVLAIAIARFFG